MNQPTPEITLKALILGIILSMVLAGANAYLGLFAGMTVSASIPAAVISMGILTLALIGITACAAIIPQKFYEKTTAKVKVKNESAYSNNGATLSKEPAKNIFEVEIKF